MAMPAVSPMTGAPTSDTEKEKNPDTPNLKLRHALRTGVVKNDKNYVKGLTKSFTIQLSR